MLMQDLRPGRDSSRARHTRLEAVGMHVAPQRAGMFSRARRLTPSAMWTPTVVWAWPENLENSRIV